MNEQITDIFDDCLKTMQIINPKIEGLAFIKNRNPIVNNQMLAKVQFKCGDGFLNKEKLGEELFYSDFPQWKKFMNQNYTFEDEGRIKISNDVLLHSEKAQLIKPISSGKYQWGIMIVFGCKTIKWTARLKNIMTHLSQLASKIFLMNHNFEKERFQDKKGKIIEKDNIINLLKAKINEQEKIIESLQVSQTPSEGSIRWKSEGEDFEEIWISMQGYKIGEKEPSTSHWKRIDNPSKISELEAILRDETKLMLA